MTRRNGTSVLRRYAKTKNHIVRRRFVPQVLRKVAIRLWSLWTIRRQTPEIVRHLRSGPEHPFENHPRLIFISILIHSKELEKIPEESDSFIRDPSVRNVLLGLPPRPKCKRRVLPPSVVGTDSNDEKQRPQKLRYKPQNTHTSVKQSVRSFRKLRDELAMTNINSKDVQRHSFAEYLKSITERLRPKSAENKVRIFKLSDIRAENSSSVPDLPTLIKTISKEYDEKNKNTDIGDRNERVLPVRSGALSPLLDESGALSTPRDGTGSQASLRGTDLASFYHMWDRSRKKRPFDKSMEKETKSSVIRPSQRNCHCAIRKMNSCARRCSFQKNSILPPISATLRES